MSTEHDDLLGAWAIEALEPDERALVDEALARDPALRHTADDLRAAVAAMGEGDAVAPPAELRGMVLQAARRVERRRPVASSPVAAYRHQVAAFDALVGTVRGDQWHLPAVPYRWTLHGLVAHLLQVERYMERTLGLADGQPDAFESDHLELGRDEIETELRRSPAETVASWRDVVGRIDPRLDALDLDHDVQFHQWIFSTRSLLVARSFEVWTHADDIRRAIGEPVVAPVPPDLRVMSAASVASLPLAIYVVADQVPDGAARVVLTGEGGGVWDLQLGAGGDELVEIVLDTVDYCRVVAGRVGRDELDVVVAGDAALADRLLAAAAIIAM
jgi:uncharacterized protein (TIGR03083 family)